MNCVAFKLDNPNILVSCSWDKTIKMWDITSGSCLSTLSCGSHALSIAVQDNLIVAGCEDGKIKLFKLNESQDWSEIQSEPPLWVDGRISSLDFSPCGTKIAATSSSYPNKYEIKIFILNPLSGDWEIGSQPPLRGHRYVPSLSREHFLSCFRY